MNCGMKLSLGPAFAGIAASLSRICGSRQRPSCGRVRTEPGSRTRMAAITVTPIAGALGAEIGGIDLGEPLGEADVHTIRQALLDHLVIFFRDQQLTSDQYLAFAPAFGTPVEYPLLKGIPGYPMINQITKLEQQ